jgi:hypothetical protein
MTGADWSVSHQVEALLSAVGGPEMSDAATDLRRTVASVRQVLVSPSPDDASLKLISAGRNPKKRRAELADLALDTITAVDYLLSLLNSPASSPPRLVLSREFDGGARPGFSLEDEFSRLTRQQLDARATTVRLGTRLTSELHSAITRS